MSMSLKCAKRVKVSCFKHRSVPASNVCSRFLNLMKQREKHMPVINPMFVYFSDLGTIALIDPFILCEFRACGLPLIHYHFFCCALLHKVKVRQRITKAQRKTKQDNSFLFA